MYKYVKSLRIFTMEGMKAEQQAGFIINPMKEMSQGRRKRSKDDEYVGWSALCVRS